MLKTLAEIERELMEAAKRMKEVRTASDANRRAREAQEIAEGQAPTLPGSTQK